MLRGKQKSVTRRQDRAGGRTWMAGIVVWMVGVSVWTNPRVSEVIAAQTYILRSHHIHAPLRSDPSPIPPIAPRPTSIGGAGVCGAVVGVGGAGAECAATREWVVHHLVEAREYLQQLEHPKELCESDQPQQPVEPQRGRS